MTKKIIFRLLILIFLTGCSNQSNEFSKKIDALIEKESEKPFSGVILISKNGETIYNKASGFSNIEEKTPLKTDDQFIIGSISKQFTAILVLQEFEKGNLSLNKPIKTYLPNLTQSWADTVTVHHLLCHMHGIEELDKPTKFPVGQQYEYSQIGYQLLADIVEKLNEKSFAELSRDLFNKSGMKNTSHPDLKIEEYLVQSYFEDETGKLVPEYDKTKYVPAGGFISNAGDLLVWNNNLYHNKLLNTDTYKMMITPVPNAVRNHPIFGTTEYGYGITIDEKAGSIRLGQTGYAPGYVCMSFYYPEQDINVIVLENTAYDLDDLKKTFSYHTKILEIIKEEFLNKKA